MNFSIKESKYHLFHIKWSSIKYDREKCIDFIKQYSKLKNNSKKFYEEIIKDVGESHIKKLIEGDYEVCRWAEIEKCSREAASELLVTGQYKKKTFKKISNLPLEDYKLILKRTKELYDMFTDIKIESETSESKIPGM